MISFSKYEEVLVTLRNAQLISDCISSMRSKPPTRTSLFLKHDVEARLERALKMAQIEAAIGHRATYYIQGDLIEGDRAANKIREISALGHEVAYHYDVLDANEGDFNKATREFQRHLDLFSALGCPIKTVCPHGNPTKSRSGWNSNKDFFRSDEIRTKYADLIDIVVDFPTLLRDGVYLSDAGRALRVIEQISTNDQTKDSAIDDGVVIDWSAIGDLAMTHSGLVLSVHPHRFYDSEVSHMIQLWAFVLLKKSYLTLRSLPGIKLLANRFYKFSRKF